jgi:hypothetical protein
MPTQKEIQQAAGNPVLQKYFQKADSAALSGRPFTNILAPTVGGRKQLMNNPLGGTIATPLDRLLADKGCNILEFAEMQAALLNKAWGAEWGTYTLEHHIGKNLSETEMPVITFDIMSRIPSTKKPGLKPRIYIIGQDDMDPDFLIIQHTQWHDCIVEYNICHTTMNEAFELMAKFEAFNTLYAGYFKQNGVMELIFRQEVPTSSTHKIDSTIPSRCVYYDMVIQNIFMQRVRATEEILAVVDANGNIPDAEVVDQRQP